MRESHSSARIAGIVLLVVTFLFALFTRDSRVAAVMLTLSGLGWIACVRSHATSGPGLPLFWVVALGLRLAALAHGPQFSDDVQRYAWEGEVLLDGKSPYAFAPAAPELAELRARLPELAARVGHPDVPAVYPPLAQACGVATAALVRASGAAPGPANVWVLRLVFLAADLGLLILLLRAQRRGRLAPQAGLTWGWCPLVCVEFAGSGHLDSLGILFLSLALLALPGARASVWSGLGAAVKFLPLCVLPWIGTGLARGRRVLLAAAALALLALSYAPFLLLEGGGRGFGAGLHEYGERWESASLVYRWVEPFVREHFGAGLSHEETRLRARIVVGIVWAALAFAALLRSRDAWSGAGAILGALLVLSPTLHPWYVLWMLPFLAQRPNLAWSWLAAGAALFYWPLDAWKSHGRWSEPPWIWWLVALPFAALWIRERLTAARR